MKRLLYILILLMLIAPVSAITYNDEYYKTGVYTNSVISYWLVDSTLLHELNKGAGWGTLSDIRSLLLTSLFESHRHTILMEKQNELLEEQNGLLRNASRTKYHCGINKSMDGYDCISTI